MNILIRGGGDIASGVAMRLHRAGFQLVMTELAEPRAVRRAVSFAEAVYDGDCKVEDISAKRASTLDEALSLSRRSVIQILIAPTLDSIAQAEILTSSFSAIVDARLLKQAPSHENLNIFTIGLGPGFEVGMNCDCVVETMRGHTLGRVYWQGHAMADTSMPEGDPRRVLRAPVDGKIIGQAKIGERLEANQIVAVVQQKSTNINHEIFSPFKGVLRGLIRSGLEVTQHLKVGDVDARNDPSNCFLVSDKALAIGGGVLEALLSKQKL